MRASDLVLAIGATLRLTRFITTDWLGEWTIGRAAKRWAARREMPAIRDAAERWRRDHTEHTTYALRDGSVTDDYLAAFADTLESEGGVLTRRAKLVKGLDCGYCLSPWITGGLLIGTAIASRIPVVRVVWRWLMLTLAGSYLVGHVWERLDV